MKVPKLKIENGELSIDGDFEFQMSQTIVNEEFIPIKKITSAWSVEVSQAEINTFGENEIIELFAEKLKQDFIKLTKK
jgi:hypothetical protein